MVPQASEPSAFVPDVQAELEVNQVSSSAMALAPVRSRRYQQKAKEVIYDEAEECPSQHMYRKLNDWSELSDFTYYYLTI